MLFAFLCSLSSSTKNKYIFGFNLTAAFLSLILTMNDLFESLQYFGLVESLLKLNNYLLPLKSSQLSSASILYIKLLIPVINSLDLLWFSFLMHLFLIIMEFVHRYFIHLQNGHVNVSMVGLHQYKSALTCCD